MSGGNARWVISSYSPMERCRIERCVLWTRFSTCSTEERDESKPGVGGIFSLAWRSRVRELLRSISRSEKLGVGNLLACWRLFQLDHCAMVVGTDNDTGSHSSTARGPVKCTVLGLRLWGALGAWGTHVRPDHALPRNVSRDGG